jgi:hypothetical protein
MASHDLTFGVFVPQGWKMELLSIEDPQAKWARAVEIAQLAEELGYDSLWVYDHFHNVPRPSNEAVFECWTTMAALAESTVRFTVDPSKRLGRATLRLDGREVVEVIAVPGRIVNVVTRGR